MSRTKNGPRAQVAQALEAENLRTLQLTVEQADILTRLNQQAETARQQLQLALTTVLAGHGLRDGVQVRQLNPETHELTVKVG